jgi:hypothetical protein
LPDVVVGAFVLVTVTGLVVFLIDKRPAAERLDALRNVVDGIVSSIALEGVNVSGFFEVCIVIVVGRSR